MSTTLRRTKGANRGWSRRTQPGGAVCYSAVPQPAYISAYAQVRCCRWSGGQPGCEGAAMESDKIYDYVGIFTFLSRALIVLAFLMSCFLAWRAILWLRDRRNLNDGAVEDIEDLKDPWEQAISRPAAELLLGRRFKWLWWRGRLGRDEPAGARGAAPVRWHQEAAEGHQATPEGCHSEHEPAATGRVPPDPRLPRGTEGR